ncbi:MAG: hypothetical protein AABW99_00315 [archaeon]
MKAVFQVKTIESDWRPPFKKKIETISYTADNEEEFDQVMGNGNHEHVFKVLSIAGDNAKLEYSRLFTLKEGNDQAKGKTLSLSRGEEQSIAYLWGERGVTKIITYKGIAAPEPREAKEEAREIEIQTNGSEE